MAPFFLVNGVQFTTYMSFLATFFTHFLHVKHKPSQTSWQSVNVQHEQANKMRVKKVVQKYKLSEKLKLYFSPEVHPHRVGVIVRIEQVGVSAHNPGSSLEFLLLVTVFR